MDEQTEQIINRINNNIFIREDSYLYWKQQEEIMHRHAIHVIKNLDSYPQNAYDQASRAYLENVKNVEIEKSVLKKLYRIRDHYGSYSN